MVLSYPECPLLTEGARRSAIAADREAVKPQDKLLYGGLRTSNPLCSFCIVATCRVLVAIL